jgi:hypothetical protein
MARGLSVKANSALADVNRAASFACPDKRLAARGRNQKTARMLRSLLEK